MIELKSISFYRRKQLLLVDFSWVLPDPGLYLITGPSGSGKSLLSQVVGGKLKPQAGSVLVDGEPLYRWFGGYRRDIFHAASVQLPVWQESLVDYVDSELRRFGARLGSLGDSWHEILAYCGGHRELALNHLATGQLALVEIALACAAPTRLAVLDGHFDLLDEEGQEMATRWLSQLGARQERFLLLTARTEKTGFPAFRDRLQLDQASPLGAGNEE